LSARSITRPSTGVLKMAVETVSLPRMTRRGRPTLMEISFIFLESIERNILAPVAERSCHPD
jgi:hypothetical protein